MVIPRDATVITVEVRAIRGRASVSEGTGPAGDGAGQR